MFPLQDLSLPLGCLLIIDRVEAISVEACGEPYMLKCDDGRVVGRRIVSLKNASLPKPSWFPNWAAWSPDVHGLCGLDAIERKEFTGEVEALNEERFFLSDLYMTVSEYVRSEDSDGRQYKVRKLRSQIESHIAPRIVKLTRSGSITDCLKNRYFESPLVKTRSDGSIMDFCLHLSTTSGEMDDGPKTMCVLVTVCGKRISNACSPVQLSNTPGSIEALGDTILLPTNNGVEFDDYFRRFPIAFHRDILTFR